MVTGTRPLGQCYIHLWLSITFREQWLNCEGESNAKNPREKVGEYVHIFTHIRLKMYIELLVLRSQDLHREKGKGLLSYKYVDAKTVATMGLTTGVRKAYNLVQKFKQSRSSLVAR
ncbi:A/G-specific adenine glycosylase MutY, bacterial form [Artemisia annua]|uniref:A/G-specific adenine glycosylase MutY, bacterial form n=1 Tax=Artemisia annua TaxID=35608 RepID=A0A2U1L426_ARTAN|nr:A/G-specific adenine glycosylase MutY, bacterial form [Artemisia annua]